jgi:hypothetical protein
MSQKPKAASRLQRERSLERVCSESHGLQYVTKDMRKRANGVLIQEGPIRLLVGSGR